MIADIDELSSQDLGTLLLVRVPVSRGSLDRIEALTNRLEEGLEMRRKNLGDTASLVLAVARLLLTLLVPLVSTAMMVMPSMAAVGLWGMAINVTVSRDSAMRTISVVMLIRSTRLMYPGRSWRSRACGMPIRLLVHAVLLVIAVMIFHRAFGS